MGVPTMTEILTGSVNNNSKSPVEIIIFPGLTKLIKFSNPAYSGTSVTSACLSQVVRNWLRDLLCPIRYLYVSAHYNMVLIFSPLGS